ncbi:MAG: serine/threonine protein phosphatase [Chloroflexota bacterium]|nr:serine/threonine protein phosphatase [Chloroflexota bacterium]
MSKLFAVGDIHGRFTELAALMDSLRSEAGLRADSDTIVFLGDYVDGGPDTRLVVEQLIAWQERYPHWRFLKGNHEDMMLDALVYNSRTYGFYDMWWGQGGRATALSYLPEDASDYDHAIMQPREFIPPHHLEWLNSRPLTHEQDGYVFVHAGFAPRIGLAAQAEEDMLWIRERFVNSDWDFDGKRVVFGHTPFDEPLVMPNKIGIDTMFHDFGKLTAVELNTANVHPDPIFYFSPAVVRDR